MSLNQIYVKLCVFMWFVTRRYGFHVLVCPMKNNYYFVVCEYLETMHIQTNQNTVIFQPITGQVNSKRKLYALQ